MTNIAFVICVILGIASMAVGYSVDGLVNDARWLLLIGMFWLLAKWRNWKWFAPLALLLIMFAAAYGLWIGLSFGWMVLGAVCGLLAWDLTDFSNRLKLASPSDDIVGMERRHILRVGIVAVLGGLLAIAAMIVHVQFSFEVVAGLVILAVIGISRLVVTLRKE